MSNLETSLADSKKLQSLKASFAEQKALLEIKKAQWEVNLSEKKTQLEAELAEKKALWELKLNVKKTSQLNAKQTLSGSFNRMKSSLLKSKASFSSKTLVPLMRDEDPEEESEEEEEEEEVYRRDPFAKDNQLELCEDEEVEDAFCNNTSNAHMSP